MTAAIRSLRRGSAGHNHVFADGPGFGETVEARESEVMDLLELLKPAWWAKAACRRSTETADFHPEEGHDRYAAEDAKKVCMRCPVWGECYKKHVLENVEYYGVWAGFTKKGAQAERRRLGIKLVGGGVQW